jgi:asparagine synthase (glutamine-hydrolysing)
MSRTVKVGLTGTGGDELFGNYGKFRVYEDQRLPKAFLALHRYAPEACKLLADCMSPLARVADRLPSSWPWVGQGHFLSQAPGVIARPFGHYYYANFEYLSDHDKRDNLLRTKNGNLQDTASFLQNLYVEAKAIDIRNGLTAVDFRTQLAEEFLFMTDRFSMAHSLEARVPFLDHVLVEKVFSIPSRLRTQGSDLKYLFKRAIADLLPPELLTSRKRGFVIPLELWLRVDLRPLVVCLLNPQRLEKQGFFHGDFYHRFVLPHLEGKATYTWQIWAALMFQLWHVVFLEQNEKEAPLYDWKAVAEID